MCEDYEAAEKIDLAKRKKLDADLMKAFKSPRKPNPAKIEDMLSAFGKYIASQPLKCLASSFTIGTWLLRVYMQSLLQASSNKRD